MNNLYELFKSMYRKRQVQVGYCYYGATPRYCEVVVSYENISVLYMPEFLFGDHGPVPGVLIVQKVPQLGKTADEVVPSNEYMHIHKWNLQIAVYEREGELHATHPGRFTAPLHEWHADPTVQTSRYAKGVVGIILKLNKQL